jgi:nitrite reductase (NADH) large subunit
MRKDSDMICYCQEVTYGVIKQAIKNGAKTVDEITDQTEAGLACGGCIVDLEEILEELNNQ